MDCFSPYPNPLDDQFKSDEGYEDYSDETLGMIIKPIGFSDPPNGTSIERRRLMMKAVYKVRGMTIKPIGFYAKLLEVPKSVCLSYAIMKEIEILFQESNSQSHLARRANEDGTIPLEQYPGSALGLPSEVDIELGRPIEMDMSTCLQIILNQEREKRDRMKMMPLDLSNDARMKVAKTILAITGQAAVSFMSYTLNGPSSSAIVKWPSYFVIAANAVGFLATLTAIFLHPKKKVAARIMEKIGAIAAASGIIVAMGMFLPRNIIWISGFACLIPCIVVALA